MSLSILIWAMGSLVLGFILGQIMEPYDACRHKWGKWILTRETDKDGEHYYWNRRMCEKCGYTQDHDPDGEVP